MWRWALVLVTALVVALVTAPSAGAHLFWGSEDYTIGRANLDGTDVNEAFMGPEGNSSGVAVDRSHLYWANYENRTIGRANLDGTEPDEAFITAASGPSGLAVDGSHVYWADLDSGSIGRANLDGTEPNEKFIVVPDPLGVAVDRSYIYWTSIDAGTIGRARLDGSDVQANFITGASAPIHIAVDGTHVYWANNDGNSIGRANLDGTSAQQDFIVDTETPRGLAVDDTHIYWADYFGRTIGRAKLDGTDATPALVTTTSRPDGLALSPVNPARSPGAAKRPTKIRVQRAGLRRGRLDVLARIAQRATGRVKVRYRAAGRTLRFKATIKNGTIRFARKLGGAQRRLRTGILTLTYAGNDAVDPDSVRLRAANGRARLSHRQSAIDGSDRLHVSGSITRRARGVVHIRLRYEAVAGRVQFVRFKARVERGRWSLSTDLPDGAAQAGGQLSITFTGYRPRRIRGEQINRAVAP